MFHFPLCDVQYLARVQHGCAPGVENCSKFGWITWSTRLFYSSRASIYWVNNVCHHLKTNKYIGQGVSWPKLYRLLPACGPKLLLVLNTSNQMISPCASNKSRTYRESRRVMLLKHSRCRLPLLCYSKFAYWCTNSISGCNWKVRVSCGKLCFICSESWLFQSGHHYRRGTSARVWSYESLIHVCCDCCCLFLYAIVPR